MAEAGCTWMDGGLLSNLQTTVNRNLVWIYILCEFNVTAVICWCVCHRAGLCCPGCRGWKPKESCWRSPAGWLTHESWRYLADRVSVLSHCIIHTVCLFVFKHAAAQLCLFSLLTASLSSSPDFSPSLILRLSFHLPLCRSVSALISFYPSACVTHFILNLVFIFLDAFCLFLDIPPSFSLCV